MEKGKTLNQLSVDDSFEYTTTVTEEMVYKFAEATGDSNPVHLDEEFARQTIFKTRVAHGMLSAGLISSVLGTRFPGVGTIYLSQTLEFKRPVFSRRRNNGPVDRAGQRPGKKPPPAGGRFV